MKPEKDRTYYSPQVKGDDRNYRWDSSFDYTDGYIGINQTSNGKLERILLLPAQVKSLIAFATDPVANQQQELKTHGWLIG